MTNIDIIFRLFKPYYTFQWHRYNFLGENTMYNVSAKNIDIDTICCNVGMQSVSVSILWSMKVK